MVHNSNMKKVWKKRAAGYLVWVVFGVLVILLGVQYEKRISLQRSIAEKVLRFHVIANSDSREDQKLKLKVRDAVGALMAEKLQGAENREECEKRVLAASEEICSCAKAVMEAERETYDVDVRVADAEFPAKAYGSYVFPAGEYRALEVVIGEGAGHNWWCVMYPNMCFAGSVYEVVEEDAKEALQEVLSEEEYESVVYEGDYELRFKYLTFLNGLVEEIDD